MLGVAIWNARTAQKTPPTAYLFRRRTVTLVRRPPRANERLRKSTGASRSSILGFPLPHVQVDRRCGGRRYDKRAHESRRLAGAPAQRRRYQCLVKDIVLTNWSR